MTLKTVLPELSKEGRFQEWFRLTIDEGTWDQLFDTYLQKILKNNEENETGETAQENQKKVTTQRARANELAEPLIRQIDFIK